MCLVSIIIPYYNNFHLLNKTLLSVFSQSYKNFEIILIYDSQNKSDLNLIKKIIKSNKRYKFKLIINKKNIGAGESRNKGIKFAKGQYLAFLDSDDIWKKDKLLKQVTFMKKNNLEFTHTPFTVVDENNNFLYHRESKTFFKFDELLPSCDIGLSTVIVKRKLISSKVKFSKSRTKEDFFLWLQLLKRGHVLSYYSHKLSYWRKSKQSLSSSIFQKLKDGFKLYNFYFKFNKFISFYFLLRLSLNFIIKKKYK